MAAMIIAIDGPAASGKGTLGKRLAHHYGYRHLDTGVIYRAVAKALLDEGFDLTDEARAVAVAMELDPERFGHPELKSQRIGDAASVVSAIPSVREALVSFQRQFAADPPGAVLDGRDIGTVICPNADVKIFVVADPQVRARRRTLEALARGEAADEAMVLADILKRDERDKNRAAAPLKAAADAHILDNSNLDIEGGVQAAIAIVEAVRAKDCKRVVQYLLPGGALRLRTPSAQAACEEILASKNLVPQLAADRKAKPKKLGETRDFGFYGVATKKNYYTLIVATRRGAPAAKGSGNAAAGIFDYVPNKRPVG